MADDEVQEEQVNELTLDQVFAPDESKDEPEQTTGEESDSTTVEAESAEEEAEAKSDAEAESEDEASTPEEEKKEEPWHITAVMDEREKRQAAQKRVEELEKQLKELQKGGDDDSVSVFDDEKKFAERILNDVDQKVLNRTLNMSQAIAEREFGKDTVAEKLAAFKDMASDNQELLQRVYDAPSPYHELIDIVDKHEKAKEMENIDEYREKVRAEERAKLEKEFQEKLESEGKKREAVTPSLASARSTGGNQEAESLIGVEDVFNG